MKGTVSTVLLVGEDNVLKARLALSIFDHGYNLATCTFRHLRSAVERLSAPPALVVAAPRDERDAFAVLSELRTHPSPAVLVTKDPALRERLGELAAVATVCTPSELGEVLGAGVPVPVPAAVS